MMLWLGITESLSHGERSSGLVAATSLAKPAGPWGEGRGCGVHSGDDLVARQDRSAPLNDVHELPLLLV